MTSEIQTPPCIRWGILGTGNISTKFAKDLLISQTTPSAPVRHVIEAIGTSSSQKGMDFTESTMSGAQAPTIYTNYNDLYKDDQVDIVYVGIPHSLHKEACLAAIAGKKHVLCEKPMAINSSEVEAIITAAREKGVFLMEGVWTRFLPAVRQLKKLIHKNKVIGHVSRMYCDFGSHMKMDSLPTTCRLKDLALGGGALLDLGIYPLTLSNLVLDGEVGDKALQPEVTSSMTVVDGVDHSNVVVVNYTSRKCLGILTTTFETSTGLDFCRIEGSEGVITLSGSMAAKPETIRIKRYDEHKEEIHTFEHPGTGFYFQANAVALDILAGRVESSVMPLAESMRVVRIIDEIRKAGGVVYPQDLQ